MVWDATLSFRVKSLHPTLQTRWVSSLFLSPRIFLGVIQEIIYNHFYAYLFGTATTVMVATRKVLFNAVFHNALICIVSCMSPSALVPTSPYRHHLSDDMFYFLVVAAHGLRRQSICVPLPFAHGP